MTVTGSGQIIRNPGTSSGGAMRVDHLYWSDGGASDSDSFDPIPVAAGITLVIWAWWRIPGNSDLYMNVYIDHEPVDPTVPTVQTSVDDWFSGSFHTAVSGLSAGDHTVGLSTDGGPLIGLEGGLVVMHVPSGSFFEQSRLGG